MNSLSPNEISGIRNEAMIADGLLSVSKDIYRNVVLNTTLTGTGVTEIDIAMFYKGVIFLIETKRVSKVEGTPSDMYWMLTTPSKTFKCLNITVQSRLHSKIFSNRFYELYGHFPCVRNVVVVPNGTEIDTSLSDAVFTLDRFKEILSMISVPMDDDLHYKFINMMGECSA